MYYHWSWSSLKVLFLLKKSLFFICGNGHLRNIAGIKIGGQNTCDISSVFWTIDYYIAKLVWKKTADFRIYCNDAHQAMLTDLYRLNKTGPNSHKLFLALRIIWIHFNSMCIAQVHRYQHFFFKCFKGKIELECTNSVNCSQEMFEQIEFRVSY